MTIHSSFARLLGPVAVDVGELVVQQLEAGDGQGSLLGHELLGGQVEAGQCLWEGADHRASGRFHLVGQRKRNFGSYGL